MPGSGLPARLLLLTVVLALFLAALLFVLLWTPGGPARAQDDASTERPTKPTELSVKTTKGSLDVSVDWNNVAGADKYWVRWRLHGPGQNLNQGARPTSSDTQITVADYGRWVVRVQACNRAGCSGPVVRTFDVEPAPEPTATPTPEPAATPTPEPQAPAKPAGLRVAATPGSLDVSLDWDEVAGADSYRVRWREGVRGTRLNEGVSVSASRADITVADYGEWVVKVNACSGDRCGPGRSTRFQVEAEAQSNRAPVVNGKTDRYASFIQAERAPRGALASKPYGGIFSDPDGDSLTYSVSVPDDRRQVVELVGVHEPSQRVVIRLHADGDWESITPLLPDPLNTRVTLTATDPDGLWASVSGDFTTRWGSDPPLAGTSSFASEQPGQPEGLAVSSKPGDLNVSATWEATPGASGYRVRWRPAGGSFAPPDRAALSDAETTLTMSGYGEWEVHLQACNTLGCGPGAMDVVDIMPVAVCDRTPAVRGGIVKKVPGVTDCAEVTAEHLNAITGTLFLDGRGIAALKVGDLDGLAAVTGLHLAHNRLVTLPEGLFEDMEKLGWVRLNNNRLIELDANRFSGLDSLHTVNLDVNNLRTIPPGLFTAHQNLQKISLERNELIAIPAGAFDGLVNIHTLQLRNNRIAGLPAGLLHDLGALTILRVDGPLNPGVCSRSREDIQTLLGLLPRDDLGCRQVTDGDIAAAMPTAGICGRTPAVRTAIVAKVPEARDCSQVTDAHLAAITGDMHIGNAGIRTLRPGDFDGLSALNGLNLAKNEITELPDDVFEDLAALTWLHLDNNRLTTLPVGSLSGLTNLKRLQLNNNLLATLPSGLFDGLNGLTDLHMHANRLTSLPAGSLTDLTSIGLFWRDAAVDPDLCRHPQEKQSAILDELSEISNCQLVTDTDVAQALAAIRSLPVCDRTPSVRDAIVGTVEGVTACADVTDEHLPAITGDLSLNGLDIAALKAGDFGGLTSLTGLLLQDNDLSALPQGLFNDLASLSTLRLSDNRLTGLDPRHFARLTGLASLYLDGNSLTTLPSGLLANNTNLVTLSLDDNELDQLPYGLFDGLTRLETLRLSDNELTTLPAGLFADLTAIKTLQLEDAVNPGLCERDQDERDAILEQLPDISDCRLATDSDIDALSLPNIILIMADDLGYGDLGSYGQTDIKTPRLDAMAAAGMRFTDFYAGHTICPPSREALLTGRHTGHTILRSGTTLMDRSICDARTTLAQMLKSAGYRTAIIGKWGVGGERTLAQPHDLGFDHFYGYLEHIHAHNAYPDMLFRNREQVKLRNVLRRDRSWATGGWVKPNGRIDFAQDLLMEEALKFVAGTSETGQPFFLYLPVTLPHANSSGTGWGTGVMETPPDGYGQYADEPWGHPAKSYAALVSHLDRDVGRLLDRLEELGIANNTVAFFTSDNGPHNEGNHWQGTFNSSGPLRGGKRSLHEGGIRAPLIAHWPGSITAGSVTDHVSASWDFMSTLADIAGFPAPKSGDGVSMRPTLLGEGAQTDHEYLYWNFTWGSTAGPVDDSAVRWGDWKATRQAFGGRSWISGLYNLATDPGETQNVAGNNPDVMAKMREIFSEAHTPVAQVRAGFCFIDRLEIE